MKSETHINLHFTGFSTDCLNSAEKVIVHSEWDIITADPRSNQVIHRRMYKVEWTSKPALWRAIENGVHKAMERSVKGLSGFFRKSSVYYLEGEPYERPTYENGTYVHYINEIKDKGL